jgi:hypothetical protein
MVIYFVVTNNGKLCFGIMKDNFFVILGNQLFDPKYLKDQGCNEVFMAEDYGLCTYVNHHKLKIYLFLTAMREYWDELKRVSKNQIIWGANWYGKYFGVGGICWFKDNTGNYSPCEYAYQSFNNHIHHIKYRWNGMLQQDMKNKEIRIHPTQKPVALYKWLLNKFADKENTILDTHLGSGSIAIACHDMGFDLTGIEIDKEYFEAAKKRLETHVKQLSVFDTEAGGQKINIIQTDIFNNAGT